MKRFFLTTCLAICALMIVAQTLDYPIVEKDGKDYYSYTVQPKDGLYGIARKFGVSQAVLHACNAQLAEGLKIGQVILVPVVEKVDDVDAGDFIIHEVTPRQTLYSLARKYSVTIPELLKFNPELTEGLRVGQKLRIPKVAFSAERQAQTRKAIETQEMANIVVTKHMVQKGETLYSISRKYGISVEELVDANDVKTPLPTGIELIIPKPKSHAEIPTQIVVADTISVVIQNDSAIVVDSVKTIAMRDTANVQNPEALQIAVLLPFMQNMPYVDASVNYFWEFYRGVLVGLEDVKRAGISVELHTYDIEKTLPALDSVLQIPLLKKMDLIIGPAYANQVAPLAKFAKEHHIYTMIPFTSKFENESNEYLLQFNPSQERILPFVAQTIVERFGNQQFVIARVTDKSDKANLLADEVTKKLHAAGKPYHEIALTEENLDTLQSLVGNQRTLLLLATQRADFVASVLPKIKTLSLPFLQIFGFEDWKNWTRFHDGTYFYSLFNRQDVENYDQRYKKWFGDHTITTEPHYDLIGYDIINFMAQALNINRENPTLAFDRVEQRSLQSDFSFRKNDENQWINTNWYLFGFYNNALHEVK